MGLWWFSTVESESMNQNKIPYSSMRTVPNLQIDLPKGPTCRIFFCQILTSGRKFMTTQCRVLTELDIS